ncbi:MAG: diaminopimelate decarboxylase [bacterium]
MHYFQFRNEVLHCENLPVESIAEQIDTPFYLYSKKTLLENYRRNERAFQGVEHLICYALKANSNGMLLRMLAQQGAGADVVSGGELQLALQAGFPADKIVFAGVGKRDEEIRQALEYDVLALNVESEEELRVVDLLARDLGKTAPVALRLNPDIDIEGHPYISTGKAVNKFGIDMPTANRVFQEIKKYANIKLVGLHCHIGSQITRVEPYIQIVKFLSSFVKELREMDLELSCVDMGGGVGVPYQNALASATNEAARVAGEQLTIEKLMDEIRGDLQALNARIIFEPGRSLIAEAGILVTKVLFRKCSGGKHFVIVDAGMTDLLRPSLYQAYHEIVAVHPKSAQTFEADVVGPICETGDFLAQNRELPQVERGDLLAVMTAGAYGYALTSNYNARPKPAEVLVDESEFQIIRERGKITELY